MVQLPSALELTTLTVDDVVRQLCANLGIPGTPSNFALRHKDTDELVVNEDLPEKIKNRSNLGYAILYHVCNITDVRYLCRLVRI